MLNMILQSLPFIQGIENGTTDGGILAMLAGMLIFTILISLGLYVYLSIAFMSIGKKAKDPMYGLAWIPGIGPAIISFRASGMHWWPWLLLIGFFIPFINVIAQLTFAVFSIIWIWKTFEKIGKPGWWAILTLIPVVNLIIIGIAAWSK
ncbi:MAG: hypothetical protein ACOCUU_00035 [Nanoarchaeota archaeon]